MIPLRDRNDTAVVIWREFHWAPTWPRFCAAVHAWWCGNPFFD